MELGCIGRERELARLSAVYATAGARAALVVGGPGMGKAALVAELVRRWSTATPAPAVLRGRCRAGAAPYEPFRQMALDAGDASMVARLDDDEGAGRWEQRRAGRFAEIAAWLTQRAEAHPLHLVVERIDLADGATRDLLAWLTTLSLPLQLLFTSRHDERWLGAVERVELGPLDADGVRAILQSPAVVAWLQRASGGRPRAIEERLAGVARSSAPAQLLLAAGAIYGRPAATATLARLAGLDDDAAARAVDELVASDQARSDGERIILTGDGESALAALDEPTRRRLHLAAGRALASDDVVRAADHLVRAGAGEEAVDAALVAGERLERACGYDRAIELYRGAAALTARPRVAERLDERLCELLRVVGDFSQARVHAERLRARAPADAACHRRLAELLILGDDLAAALGVLDAAELLHAGRHERARLAALRAEALYGLGRTDEARTIDAAGAPIDVQLQLGNTHAKALLAQGAYAEAAQGFALHAEAAHAAGRPFDECRALYNLGIAQLRLGDRDGAEQRYRAALAVAEAAGDLRNRAFCLQNLGVLAHHGHDYATALDRFGAALTAFAQIGQRARVAWVALDLASVYVDLNQPARAEAELARAAIDEAPAVVAIDRAQLAGRIAWRRGDWSAARAALDEALAAALAAGDHDRAIEARLALARVALDGDGGDRAACAALLTAIGSPASPATRARALVLRGELDVTGGELAQARMALQEALLLAGRSGDVDSALRAQLWLARGAERAGDAAAVARHFGAARALDGELALRVPAAHRAAFAADPLRRAFAAPVATVSAPAASDGPTGRGRLLGRHPRMLELYRLIDKLAPDDALVLIRGESGTGKELVAEALHAGSPRRDRPLVKVNCGALVETLLHSELFGHERGAFTGAVARKPGRFEAAHGGTLFLDEIGDISPHTQAALLRVLSDGELVRVGGTQPLRVDVRILCATNRDLEAMVTRGHLRQDLYYRLQGLTIELPPLRARPGDLPLLCEALLDRNAAERRVAPRSLSPEALALLTAYDWPGNVRELENVLRAASVFAEGEIIGARDLADYTAVGDGVASRVPERAPSSAWQRLGAEKLSLKALKTRIEIECIQHALARSAGNITRAAAILGMKRPRLSQLIKEHGIAVGDPSDEGAAR